MPAAAPKPFTGRHISAILVTFFAVVIAVNFLMAHYATSTFGGVVVENSYVASQHFNRWLDEAAREKALGWTATASRQADGKVAIDLKGAPQGVTLTAEARHPLGQLADQTLRFSSAGADRFVSETALPAGRWTLRIAARSGKDLWRTELQVQ